MLNMGHPTNLDVAAGLVDRSRKFLYDMVLWEANGMGIWSSKLGSWGFELHTDHQTWRLDIGNGELSQEIGIEWARMGIYGIQPSGPSMEFFPHMSLEPVLGINLNKLHQTASKTHRCLPVLKEQRIDLPNWTRTPNSTKISRKFCQHHFHAWICRYL